MTDQLNEAALAAEPVEPGRLLLFVYEPDGGWRCNTCYGWAPHPQQHAAEVHGVTDSGRLILAEDGYA